MAKKMNDRKRASGLLSPISGIVLDVKTKASQSHRAGEELFIIYSMKMEIHVTAARPIEILDVRVQKDQYVEMDQPLALVHNFESDAEE